MNEISIFISGSISKKKLPKEVISAIYNCIDRDYKFIVGDANGIDRSVQEILRENSVQTVEIFHIGEKPRNHLSSDWKHKEIYVEKNNLKLYKNNRYTRDAQFLKDNAMAKSADMGLVIWQDTTINRFGNLQVSKGSLRNIVNLLSDNKFVGIFLINNPELGIIRHNNIEQFESDVIHQHVHDKTREYYYSYKKGKINEQKKYEKMKRNNQLSLFDN